MYLSKTVVIGNELQAEMTWAPGEQQLGADRQPAQRGDMAVEFLQQFFFRNALVNRVRASQNESNASKFGKCETPL